MGLLGQATGKTVWPVTEGLRNDTAGTGTMGTAGTETETGTGTVTETVTGTVAETETETETEIVINVAVAEADEWRGQPFCQCACIELRFGGSHCKLTRSIQQREVDAPAFVPRLETELVAATKQQIPVNPTTAGGPPHSINSRAMEQVGMEQHGAVSPEWNDNFFGPVKQLSQLAGVGNIKLLKRPAQRGWCTPHPQPARRRVHVALVWCHPHVDVDKRFVGMHVDA